VASGLVGAAAFGLGVGGGVVGGAACLLLAGVAPPVSAVNLEAIAVLVLVLVLVLALLPVTPKLPGFDLQSAPYRRVERTTNEQNLMMMIVM